MVWAQILPRWGHYKLVTKDILGEDGFWRVKIIKVYDDASKNEENELDYISNHDNSSEINTSNKEEQIEYIISGKESSKEDVADDASYHERHAY